MCGIIGYTGVDQAVPVLLDSLKKLEYRGYDSAGIAVVSEEGIRVEKTIGKVDCLVEKVKEDGIIDEKGETTLCFYPGPKEFSQRVEQLKRSA